MTAAFTSKLDETLTLATEATDDLPRILRLVDSAISASKWGVTSSGGSSGMRTLRV